MFVWILWMASTKAATLLHWYVSDEHIYRIILIISRYFVGYFWHPWCKHVVSKCRSCCQLLHNLWFLIWRTLSWNVFFTSIISEPSFSLFGFNFCGKKHLSFQSYWNVDLIDFRSDLKVFFFLIWCASRCIIQMPFKNWILKAIVLVHSNL